MVDPFTISRHVEHGIEGGRKSGLPELNSPPHETNPQEDRISAAL
jgi:hypothetical protein